MNTEMNAGMPAPEETLAEIRRRQEQTVRDALELPWWFYAGWGALITVNRLVAEFVGPGDWWAWISMIAVAVLVLAPGLRLRRRMRAGVWDPATTILGIVWGLAALALWPVVGAAADGMGMRYPGLIGAVASSAVIALTGPPVSRRLAAAAAVRIARKMR